MVIWLYVAVVRPIITYAATVWWSRTEQTTVRTKLNSLQRLVCLGTTGVITTTPTAAMETILNLTLLDIYIRGVARMGAYKLQVSESWRPTFTRMGDTKITDKIQNDTLLMTLDTMVKKHSFARPFKVLIDKREGWNAGDYQITNGDLVWYTDGSSTKERTGAGVHGLRPERLGRHATVFQPEVYAIIYYVLENIKRSYYNRIFIFSDSQAALKALNSFLIKSKLVWNCFQLLLELAEHNKVKKLIWMPGHSGVEGNEKADQLAKLGADEPLLGPEPLTKKTARRAMDLWAQSKARMAWKHTPGQRHAKKMINKSSNKLTSGLLILSRNQMRLVVGLLTGHCHLRKHLHRLGIYEEEPVCKKCGMGKETAHHILHPL
jgi:ribonuclease HI